MCVLCLSVKSIKKFRRVPQGANKSVLLLNVSITVHLIWGYIYRQLVVCKTAGSVPITIIMAMIPLCVCNLVPCCNSITVLLLLPRKSTSIMPSSTHCACQGAKQSQK